MTGKDVTGQIFGRLVVIGESLVKRVGSVLVDCLCSCGNKKIVAKGSLLSGDTRSCGCYNVEQLKARTKHGKCNTATYYSWHNMKNRCSNPKAERYEDYGGRGITICERWLSFENFLADMGEKPFPKAQIDRIDNNRGYSPDNCKWSSILEQARNKRNNVYYEHNGLSLCVPEWAEKYGINSGTVHSRLNRGWTIASALETHVNRYKRERKPVKLLSGCAASGEATGEVGF